MNSQIEDYEKVLEWYAEKTEAVVRYGNKKQFRAIDAVISELTLDCGTRARDILKKYKGDEMRQKDCDDLQEFEDKVEDSLSFEVPVVEEVTEPAWEAIQHYIKNSEASEAPIDPLFHDFAKAITWLKERVDDERSRIILLGERLDHIQEQLSEGNMK